jgi:hypothetical protein
MKPVLKVPGTQRLKVKYEELLSSFAFSSNLRRYTAVERVQSLLDCWGTAATRQAEPCKPFSPA